MFIRGKRKAYLFTAVKWDGTEGALREILELTGKKAVLVAGEKGEDYLSYDKSKGILLFYAPGFGYMSGILGEMFIRTEDNKFNVLPENIFYKNFDIDAQYPIYTVGEPVLYQNGDRFELGVIKTVCDNDEYFVNYHTGDTASKTHARNLHKIENRYAFEINRLKVDD